MARLTLLLLLAVLPAAAAAQAPEAPNGVLLVARPGLPDPRFSETVVLVTQTKDFQTVGVILNRPTELAVSQFIDSPAAQGHAEPLFYGGPVLGRSVVALFRAAEAPGEPAFHVLENLYLSMHPAIVERLLGGRQARYRLYAGFAAWGPRQLESEVLGESWYLLPADDEIVFREDTSGMWDELLERARALHASATTPRRAAALSRTSSCRPDGRRRSGPSARSALPGWPSRADSRSRPGWPA